MGSCLSRDKAVAPNKVHPEFDEEKRYLGQRGYSKTLKSADGVDLFAYFWPANPDVPLKGVVQLAHGNAAYTCFDYLKYKGPGYPNVYEGSWVDAFNQAGFSVCGIDHQGYGRSKGARLGNKFQTHVDNLLLLSKDVLENGGAAFPKELSYFLVGHSMGGMVATLACIQQPARFSGLVLLSPMLTVDTSGKRSSSLRLGPKSRPKSDDGDSTATSPEERPVPWLYDAWATDPFVHDGGLYGSREVEELLPAAAAQLCAEGGMEAVALPLLIFQSERDTFVDPEGARKLNERAASTDKTLRPLSQQWHVLTKEEGWEALLAETTTWLSAHSNNSGALTKGLGEQEGVEGGGAAKAAEVKEDEGDKQAEAKEEVESGGDAAALAGCAAEEDGSEATAAPAPGDDEPAEASKAEVEGEAAAGGGEEVEKPERNSAPLLTRSMSMLERMPEHEPLATGGVSTEMPLRRYSFSGRMPRPGAAPGDTTPIPSGASLLGPLPPLGQRRLSSIPPDLGSYGVRGRLPPLPPLMPLLDRKPIG